MPRLLLSISRQYLAVFLAACLLCIATTSGLAQHAMPDAAPLPNFNPLCDGSLVPCLEIDDFAGHAYGHLQVLPRTDRRETAAIFPFGVTLGLFGRFAGGVSTSYAFWQENDVTYQQLGPLRLSLLARLLPLFPLFSSGGNSETNASGESYYAPPRSFRLGIAYEQEVRVGPFSGASSLGLLADLASLRVIGSKMLGPVQLSASIGALYDWRGQFASGELAAQVGIYLPFFQALKVFVEGMGRGLPAYVKDSAVLPGSMEQAPLQRQGMAGLGLSFHPHARVDLGVSVQRGFGGLAPWAVSVHFVTLSVGKTYQGRAATPVAQIAADITSVAAVRLKEFITNLPVDPILDENCVILDKDHVTVLGRFGKRTKNGYYCEEDGFRVPIGHEFERDRYATKLCRDTGLKDCFLERRGKDWVPIHRPKLDANCDMYDTDGTYLGRVGTPTSDGKRCRYPVEKLSGPYGTSVTYQEQPIGEKFHTDANRSRVCVDEAMERCFLKPSEGRGTLAVEGSERFAKRYDQNISDDVGKATDTALHTAKDVVAGNVSVSTIYEEAKRAAVQAADKATDLVDTPGQALHAAKEKAAALVQAVEDWRKKSPEEQTDDLARTAVSGTEEAILGAAVHVAGGVLGGVRAGGKLEKAGGAVGEGLGDAIQGSKKARKAAARAAKAEQEVAEHTVPAVGSASQLPSSRAARRESMRQAGIPTSQQPIKQTKSIAGYQYEYEVQGPEGRKLKAVVTQQTTDRVQGHGPHWESGMAKEPIRRDGLDRIRVDSKKAKVDYGPAK